MGLVATGMCVPWVGGGTALLIIAGVISALMGVVIGLGAVLAITWGVVCICLVVTGMDVPWVEGITALVITTGVISSLRGVGVGKVLAIS